jgi:structural maintenance of chromosome 4
LNGRDSTQAEVKDRLRAESIDLNNNRFLILQGEVEQISQMKQKSGDADKPGLLEYLEDIIGSKQFIERIEECGREYAQAEEQKH